MKILTSVRDMRRVTIGEAAELRKQGLEVVADKEEGIVRIYKEGKGNVSMRGMRTEI